MGLLEGYGGDNFTGDLYGRYSFGNQYDRLLDETFIREITLPIIEEDLRIAGMLDDIRNLDTLDVGTGRQALCMALLNAKSVHHYDLSKFHVSRFSKIIEEKYGHLPIRTTYLDICKSKLPKEAYDFVYLNGIVQHFSNTSAGLKNCAASVRLGGRIWVYFYRSGTFKWFVCSMIRRLLNAQYLDDSFVASALVYSDGQLADDIVSCIMDDFFAPYIHLYSPFQYMDFMELLGFKPCASSALDPLSFINHQSMHHSATIVFERSDVRDIEKIDTGDLLEPKSEIDQLDGDLYASPMAKNCIAKFLSVEKMAKDDANPIVIWSLCLAMHKIAAPQYYGEAEFSGSYESLLRCLNQVLELKASA